MTDRSGEPKAGAYVAIIGKDGIPDPQGPYLTDRAGPCADIPCIQVRSYGKRCSSSALMALSGPSLWLTIDILEIASTGPLPGSVRHPPSGERHCHSDRHARRANQNDENDCDPRGGLRSAAVMHQSELVDDGPVSATELDKNYRCHRGNHCGAAAAEREQHSPT